MYSKTLTRKKHNEDAILITDGLFAICDGASGLNAQDYMKTGSDAAWFSHTLLERLIKRSDCTIALEEQIGEILLEMKQEFPSVDELDEPSAALAVLRKNPAEHCLDYFVLGDCAILFQTDSETVRISDPVIADFDSLAIQEMERLSRISGTPLFEQRSFVSSILKENRMKKNTPEGYWIADLSGRWKGHALCGSITVSVRKAVLFSDGFAQLQEFEHLSDADFLDRICSDPEHSLLDLRRLQEEDWQGIALPRLKIADDTSLIVLDAADLG